MKITVVPAKRWRVYTFSLLGIFVFCYVAMVVLDIKFEPLRWTHGLTLQIVRNPWETDGRRRVAQLATSGTLMDLHSQRYRLQTVSISPKNTEDPQVGISPDYTESENVTLKHVRALQHRNKTVDPMKSSYKHEVKTEHVYQNDSQAQIKLQKKGVAYKTAGIVNSGFGNSEVLLSEPPEGQLVQYDISSVHRTDIPGNGTIHGGLSPLQYAPQSILQQHAESPIRSPTSIERNEACVQLLKKVRFEDWGLSTRLYEAAGCELLSKSYSDITECFESDDHIVFMGDSRVRQLYAYFVALWTNTPVSGLKFQNDVRSHLNGLTIEFRWQPWADHNMRAVLKRWLLLPPASRPDVILIGAGIWSVKESNGSKAGEIKYHDDLIRTLPLLRALTSNSDVIWVPQDPVNEEIFDPIRKMITNERMDRYNQIARDILGQAGIPIWWSSLSTAVHFKDFYRNRTHLKSIVDKYKVLILLNWQCNKVNTRPRQCCVRTSS